MQRIPVAAPVFNGNEETYVLDCVRSGWVSGSGKYIDAFEEKFAEFCGAKYAVAVCNGTVALHLALIALGIRAGDEVIVPDLTYIASANAVTYCGATPVFADVDPTTWTIDPSDVTRKISPRTKAIMPVHLYGHPADMNALNAIAEQYRLFVIEDAAEAHGAEYRGSRIGTLGDVSTFSFYGNKIITTGEGGIVVTNDEEIMRQVRLYKGQGMGPKQRYWFPVIGYNYRMTNIQAAIGLAQLERIDWFIERRQEVAQWYFAELRDTDLQLPAQAEWAENVFWLFCICVPETIDRDQLMIYMDEQGIETRPFFYPMHVMPPYFDVQGDQNFPVTTQLAKRGINLPSSADLSHDNVRRICQTLKRGIEIQQTAQTSVKA